MKNNEATKRSYFIKVKDLRKQQGNDKDNSMNFPINGLQTYHHLQSYQSRIIQQQQSLISQNSFQSFQQQQQMMNDGNCQSLQQQSLNQINPNSIHKCHCRQSSTSSTSHSDDNNNDILKTIEDLKLANFKLVHNGKQNIKKFEMYIRELSEENLQKEKQIKELRQNVNIYQKEVQQKVQQIKQFQNQNISFKDQYIHEMQEWKLSEITHLANIQAYEERIKYLETEKQLNKEQIKKAKLNSETIQQKWQNDKYNLKTQTQILKQSINNLSKEIQDKDKQCTTLLLEYHQSQHKRELQSQVINRLTQNSKKDALLLQQKEKLLQQKIKYIEHLINEAYIKKIDSDSILQNEREAFKQKQASFNSVISRLQNQVIQKQQTIKTKDLLYQQEHQHLIRIESKLNDLTQKNYILLNCNKQLEINLKKYDDQQSRILLIEKQIKEKQQQLCRKKSVNRHLRIHRQLQQNIRPKIQEKLFTINHHKLERYNMAKSSSHIESRIIYLDNVIKENIQYIQSLQETQTKHHQSQDNNDVNIYSHYQKISGKKPSIDQPLKHIKYAVQIITNQKLMLSARLKQHNGQSSASRPSSPRMVIERSPEKFFQKNGNKLNASCVKTKQEQVFKEKVFSPIKAINDLQPQQLKSYQSTTTNSSLNPNKNLIQQQQQKCIFHHKQKENLQKNQFYQFQKQSQQTQSNFKSQTTTLSNNAYIQQRQRSFQKFPSFGHIN